MSFVTLFLVAKMIFKLEIGGSILLLCGYYLLLVASIDSLGMIIASIAPNMRVSNLLCTIVYFPMLFLSGATIPYAVMPDKLQAVVNFLPLTHGIKLFENAITGVSTGSLLSISVLLAVFFISIIISVLTFRWE